MKYKFFSKTVCGFYILSTVLLTFFSIVINAFGADKGTIFTVWCLWLIPASTILLISYVQKRSFYNQLSEMSLQITDKYLLAALLECPNFEEGQMIFDILQDYGNACYANVSTAKKDSVDYREYIERWVHEIKNPVAALKLVVENSSSPTVMLQELDTIERFVNQVLYYARCQNPQQDFFINEVIISDIVDIALKAQARLFVTNKVTLKYEKDDVKILADTKWVVYILEQILSNAIKYSKGEGRLVSIFGEKQGSCFILTIKDNGIGIADYDLPRLFEKGFTGENGRKFSKSTGMGLYICDQLCQKLNIGLKVTSQIDMGTVVQLSFPLA